MHQAACHDDVRRPKRVTINVRTPEPPEGSFVNDGLGGDIVNRAALVLRSGDGPALFARLAERADARADPVMAMLATFGRPDCRAAAARPTYPASWT